MAKVYFIKAFCGNTHKPFYMRYDYAADDCWVRTYGVKELASSDATSLTSGTSDFDISNSRIGPQYKCPWCGNKRFWKHTSGHNACDNITCWDGKSNDVTCGSCGTNCTLGGGPVTTLSGTSGNGQ